MQNKPRNTQSPKLMLGAPDMPPPSPESGDAETRHLITTLARRAAKRPPVQLDLESPDFTIGDASFKPAMSILANHPEVLNVIADLNPRITIHLEPALDLLDDESPAVGVMPAMPRAWEYLLLFGPKVSAFELARALLTIQLDDELYPSPQGVSGVSNWADVMVDVELHRRLLALGIDVAGPSDAARADCRFTLPWPNAWTEETAAITLVENELWPTNDEQLVTALRTELLGAFPGIAAHADSLTRLLRGGRYDSRERAWAGLQQLSTHLEGLGLDRVSAETTFARFHWMDTPQEVHQA